MQRHTIPHIHPPTTNCLELHHIGQHQTETQNWLYLYNETCLAAWLPVAVQGVCDYFKWNPSRVDCQFSANKSTELYRRHMNGDVAAAAGADEELLFGERVAEAATEPLPTPPPPDTDEDAPTAAAAER